LFFCGQETAPSNRAHAQDFEVIGRRQGTVNALRFGDPSKRHEIIMVGEQSREAPAMVSQIPIIKIGKGRAGVVASFAPHYSDEVGRMGKTWNRVEQSCADPTKDRTGGADAEGQSQHSHNREAGRLREHAESVTEVLKQSTALALGSQVVVRTC
jgi:hypothetical protein